MEEQFCWFFFSLGVDLDIFFCFLICSCVHGQSSRVKGPGHGYCGAEARGREVGNEDESRGDKFTPLCRAAPRIAAGVCII